VLSQAAECLVRRRELYLDYLLAGSPLSVSFRDDLPFSGEHVEWALPNLLLCQTDLRTSLTSQMNWSGGERDRWSYVCLRLVVEGRLVSCSGGLQADLSHGDLSLTDMSRSDAALWEMPSFIGCYIPHEAIGYDPSRHSPILRFPAGSAQGIILGGILRNLAASMSRTSPDLAAELGSGVIDAMVPLLGLDRASDTASVDLAADRMRAISTYVRTRVRPSEEGPTEAELCHRFGISRATLYRDLASVGGLKTFVSSIRLEQAHRELAIARGARGVVRRVAERWGYYDPGHFNAAFNRKFGRAPSQVIGMSRADTAKWGDHEAGKTKIDASLLDGLRGLPR